MCGVTETKTSVRCLGEISVCAGQAVRQSTWIRKFLPCVFCGRK